MASLVIQDIPEEELENLNLSPGKLPRAESASQGSPTPPASSQATFSSTLHKQVSHLSISENGNGNEQSFDSTTREVTMEEMVSTLSANSQNSCENRLICMLLHQLGHVPPALSYSAINVPLASTSTAPSGIAILRRDLFDARFQLANQDDDSDDEGSAYGNSIPRNNSPPTVFKLNTHLQDNSPSDLIKGVYEGGLKTWEASLDLVVSSRPPRNHSLRIRLNDSQNSNRPPSMSKATRLTEMASR